MARDGVRHLERLLKQASNETDRHKLDLVVAEIYRVVAEREKMRAKRKRRTSRT
jgi:hypothetical protein